MQTSIVSALLLLGGAGVAALQVEVTDGSESEVKQKSAVDGDKPCGNDMAAYESRHIGGCTAYCLPHGTCEGYLHDGKLKDFFITGEGSCKGPGFAKVSVVTKQLKLLDWQLQLRAGNGPCKGMTRSAYEPVHGPSPPQVEGEAQAAPMQVSALAPMPPAPPAVAAPATPFPVAQAPAVPAAAAAAAVPAAEVPVAPATPAPVAIAAPAPPAQVLGAVGTHGCGPDMMGYESRTGTACTAFCLPQGYCQGMLHDGRLRDLRVTGPGACRGPGIEEVKPSAWQAIQVWQLEVRNKNGPCHGMTTKHFKITKPESETTAKPTGQPPAAKTVPTFKKMFSKFGR